MSRVSQPLSFEYILLGYLSEQPMHGYDLYRLLNTDPSMSQIWSVKQAMLYAMLDKLEEVGFLHSEMLLQGSYPARKQFSITESGLAAFREWVAQPVEHPREIRQEFMARLYFAHRMGRIETRSLLKRQEQVCLQWLELHNQHAAETEDDPFCLILIDYKQAQMESILGWVKYCLRSIPE
jgi:DNA-binding PadR family transcriptional regulator